MMVFIGRTVRLARFQAILTLSAVTIQLAKFAGRRELVVFHFLSDTESVRWLQPSEQIAKVCTKLLVCGVDVLRAAAAICAEM